MCNINHPMLFDSNNTSKLKIKLTGFNCLPFVYQIRLRIHIVFTVIFCTSYKNY